MLGQPLSMLLPEVIGFKLHRRVARGRHRDRSRADRHADAAQEGRGRQVRRVLRPRPQCDVGRRPRDASPTWRPNTARPAASSRSTRRRPLSQDVGAQAGAHRAGRGLRQGARHLPHRGSTPDPVFTDTLELDLGEVAPSLAGPKRPQDRVVLAEAKAGFAGAMTSEFKKADDARRALQGRGDELRSRPRRRRHRRDHLLHQHLEPERDDRRRPARPQRRRQGPDRQAVGQDLARAGQPGRAGISRRKPACRSRSTSSASTSSAMAARPASAIPARCAERFRRPSPSTIWSPPRCSRATAISRAASIRTCARTISPRRRWSSPMRWPARCRSI